MLLEIRFFFHNLFPRSTQTPTNFLCPTFLLGQQFIDFTNFSSELSEGKKMKNDFVLMCSRRIRFLLSAENKEIDARNNSFNCCRLRKQSENSTAIFPYHTSRSLSSCIWGKSGHARPCKTTAKLFEEFLLACFCCRFERTWRAANCLLAAWEFLARLFVKHEAKSF